MALGRGFVIKAPIMPFDSIRFHSFRNLVDNEVNVEANRIFLVGENGQGKTNFLEALYYLSYGSSFRGPVDACIAREGSSEFALVGKAKIKSNTRDMPFEELRIMWKGKTKEIKRDGKILKDRKELVDLNPAVVYCHEDFDFASGEPERRRFFFDQTAGLVSAGYIDLLRDYRRILKQRNAALKEARISILDLLDEQLAGKGVELRFERSALERNFAYYFAEVYESVSHLGKAVRPVYMPSWKSEKSIVEIIANLANKRQDEISFGTTLSGPHRDRWAFICEGENFATFASTGQLRLLSLALRTAQAGYYTRCTSRLPILLLDDVLLELDLGRKKRFLDVLPSASQSFFTFLPGEPWVDYRNEDTLVYHVTNGRFSD